MMAMYIAIRKIHENSLEVEFSFGVSEEQVGRVRIEKLTGDLKLIEPAPGDSGSRIYSRAAFKIKKHWECGELPEETCWAS